MQRLSRIHVPGLSIKYDYVTARQRLLADFPDVREVFATATPATLLVAHSGPDQRHAWRDALLDAIGAREPSAGRGVLRWRRRRANEGESPA